MHVNITGNTSHTFSATAKSVAVIAAGTWGGGTLTIELYDADLGGYMALDMLTADGNKEVVIGAGSQGRITMSGASAPDVDVLVRSLREAVV